MKSNMASKMAAKIGKYQKFSIMTLPEITMAVEFFSGSMRPALSVFILKMNTLLDIKIQAASCV